MKRRALMALLALPVLLLAGMLAAPAKAADTVVYYHTDALHSVAVVTNASGQVIERTHYAPYGQVLDRPLRDGPGYTGHREDATTGLVYMQQRYYDPESGRFISTDPVQADGDGGSFNRYWYANDNPYRYTDPDGRCPTKDKPCPPPPPKPKPKPITLPTITVTAPAIPATPGFPSEPIELPEIPAIGISLSPVLDLLLNPIFDIGIVIPGNLAPSDCGDGRCVMMSESEQAPSDAPAGTIGLDEAKRKYGLSKDETHKIKDAATGGMGKGKTWVGVAPNSEVGINEDGHWKPQGTVDGLKH